MAEFQLDAAAVRRLLGSVVAIATKGRPLSPERAGAVQALATQLGLGFQDLAEVTKKPKVRKPTARAEAEATYLAAAVLLAKGGASKDEREALRGLAGELDLGLATVELDRLAREAGALGGLRLVADAPAAPEGRKASGDRPGRDGGKKGIKKSGSDPDRAAPGVAGSRGGKRKVATPGEAPPRAGGGPPPMVLAAVGGGAVVLLLLIAAAVALLGGRTPPPDATTTDVASGPATPTSPQQPAASGGELEDEYRRAVRAWNDLQGKRQVDLGVLAGIRATLQRVVDAGRSDPAWRERAWAAASVLESEAFQERWVRSRVDLMRDVDEALEAAIDGGDLAIARQRLDAVPQALREVEKAWYTKHADMLTRCEGYTRDVRAFLDGGPAGAAALSKAHALHERGLKDNVARSGAHRDLVDWFRTQRAHSADVFKVELERRKAGKVDDARVQRRILELIEQDVRSFLGGVQPAAIVDLFASLDDRELLETIKQLVPRERWSELPVEGWLPRIKRLSGEALVELSIFWPLTAWLRMPPAELKALVAALPPLERLQVAVRVPAEAWARLSVDDVLALAAPWPPSVQEIFARFLGEKQAQEFMARLRPGEAPAPDAAMVGIGSGFYVSPRHVMTNAHVVGRATEVQVETARGATRGKVVAKDERLDLALVEVGVEGRPLALAATAVLHPVFAYGYGAVGGTNSLLLTTPGRVAAFDPALTTIIFTAHVNPGNSGGPLIDGDGRWVGVVVAKTIATSPNEDSLGIAVHGNAVLGWLSGLGLPVTVDKADARGATPPDDQVRASVVRLIVKE